MERAETFPRPEDSNQPILLLDPDQKTVKIDNIVIGIEYPLDFEVIKYFAQRPNTWISALEVADVAYYPNDASPASSSIRRLRTQLEIDPQNPQLIISRGERQNREYMLNVQQVEFTMPDLSASESLTLVQVMTKNGLIGKLQIIEVPANIKEALETEKTSQDFDISPTNITIIIEKIRKIFGAKDFLKTFNQQSSAVKEFLKHFIGQPNFSELLNELSYPRKKTLPSVTTVITTQAEEKLAQGHAALVENAEPEKQSRPKTTKAEATEVAKPVETRTAELVSTAKLLRIEARDPNVRNFIRNKLGLVKQKPELFKPATHPQVVRAFPNLKLAFLKEAARKSYVLPLTGRDRRHPVYNAEEIVLLLYLREKGNNIDPRTLKSLKILIRDEVATFKQEH